MMEMAEKPFSSWHRQLLWLVGYGRWTPCSFLRSSQVFKETPLLKNPISSQESMQLCQILVNLWASFGRFIKSTHSNKICSGNILGRQWLENWIPYMAYCTYTKCKILLLQEYLFHFLKLKKLDMGTGIKWYMFDYSFNLIFNESTNLHC